MFRRIVVAAVLVGTLAVPSVAAAQIDQFSLSRDVTLGLEGAFATTSATVQCDEGYFGQVSINLVQSSGGRLASASGSSDFFACTGEPQTLTVTLTDFSPFPLKHGKAAETGTLSVVNFDTFDFFSQTVGPVAVRIHK